MEQSENTCYSIENALYHQLTVTLGVHMCSLGSTFMFTGAPIFVYCRVLISNLRSMLEAQFDSQARATGHSYEKYNNWETV